MASKNHPLELSSESFFRAEWAAAWKQAIQRLRPELEQYITDQLGAGEAFLQKDRLIEKLELLGEQGLDNPTQKGSIDERIFLKLRFIVSDEKRRQSKITIVTQIRIGEDPEKIEDPRSLEFARLAEETVEDDTARVQKILDRTPAEMLPVIKDLFGLDGSEVKSRAEIAEECGWKRNTLDQKLRRLFKDLRESK